MVFKNRNPFLEKMGAYDDIQSTLPKSNLLGLKKKLRPRENSTYEGLKQYNTCTKRRGLQ